MGASKYMRLDKLVGVEVPYTNLIARIGDCPAVCNAQSVHPASLGMLPTMDHRPVVDIPQDYASVTISPPQENCQSREYLYKVGL